MSCRSRARRRAVSAGRPKQKPVDLEHVAKPLRRDPHVVLGLRLTVERPRREGKHLIEPHPDDPGCVLPERTGWVELLDGPSLHARAPRAPSTRSSMVSRSSLRLSSATRGELLVRLLLLAAELLDQRCDATPIGRRHLVVEVVECRDRHVAVTPFAEGIRQALDGIERLAMLLCREARLEDLEGGTQATGGHPHVVDPLDVAGVQNPLRVLVQLSRSHRNDLRGRRRVGALGGQIGNRLGLGHGTAATLSGIRRQAKLCSDHLVRAVYVPVEQGEDDPLPQAALADLQRLPEHLGRTARAAARRPGAASRGVSELEPLGDLVDLVAGEHPHRPLECLVLEYGADQRAQRRGAATHRDGLVGMLQLLLLEEV